MDWTRDLIKKCEFWQYQMNSPLVLLKPPNLQFNEMDCKLMDERWEQEKDNIMDGYKSKEENDTEIEMNDANDNIDSVSQAPHSVDNNNGQTTEDAQATEAASNIALNLNDNEHQNTLSKDENKLKTPEHENSSTVDNNNSIDGTEHKIGLEEGEIEDNVQENEYSVTPKLKSDPVVGDEDDDLSVADLKFFRQVIIGNKIDLSNSNVHILKPAIDAQNPKICAETPKFNHTWDYNKDTQKYDHPWCRYDSIMGTNGAVGTARVGQTVYFRSSLCGDRRTVKILEMQPTTDDSAGGIWKIQELNKNGELNGKIKEVHSFNFSKLNKARMYTFKLCTFSSIML